MATGIYCVLDKVAEMILGGLHLHKHDAAAVRMFTDALQDPKTIICQHPEDFVLLRIGWLATEVIEPGGELPAIPAGRISAEMVEVLSGKQWLAVQPKDDRASGATLRAS